MLLILLGLSIGPQETGHYLKVVNKPNIPLGFFGDHSTSIDIGIYKWPWKELTYLGKASPVNRRVAYIDEFRIGGAEANFDSVRIQENTTALSNQNKVTRNKSTRMTNRNLKGAVFFPVSQHSFQ
jgi:hypothetical protein